MAIFSLCQHSDSKSKDLLFFMSPKTQKRSHVSVVLAIQKYLSKSICENRSVLS